MGPVDGAVPAAGGERRMNETTSWDLRRVTLPQIGQGAIPVCVRPGPLTGAPEQLAPCRGGDDVRTAQGPERGIRVGPRKQVRDPGEGRCERRQRSVLRDEEPRSVLLGKQERG